MTNYENDRLSERAVNWIIAFLNSSRVTSQSATSEGISERSKLDLRVHGLSSLKGKLIFTRSI